MSVWKWIAVLCFFLNQCLSPGSEIFFYIVPVLKGYMHIFFIYTYAYIL